MSNFETEGAALLDAVMGRPVAKSDIQENYDLGRHMTGSANHKMGSIPAWGLDAFRRKDMAVVTDVLLWSEWYSSQPLHENEALSSAMYYRKRIDDGTYALAWLAKLVGNEYLSRRLLDRNKASVAWCSLGAWKGLACSLVDRDPHPVSDPHVLFADGPPIDNLPGAPTVPSVACAGMRGWNREDTPTGNTGPFYAHDATDLRVMLANVLGIPFDKKRTWGSHDISDVLVEKSGLPVWGLTPMDIAIAKAFAANPTDAALGRAIHGWTLPHLPNLPFIVVRRKSGAVEFLMMKAHSSSNGSQTGEIVYADGTRRLFSPDDGQRGGKASASKHHQVWTASESPTEWTVAWDSGQGKRISCPRPPESDAVAWRVDYDGHGNSSFWPGSISVPPRVPPVVPPVQAPEKERRSWWPKWS